jgi:ATP synthase F1 delta subunit
MGVAQRTYARSLFEAAREKGRLEVVRDDLQTFVEATEEVPELRAVLENPELDSKAKADVLAGLLEDADELVRNFLAVLIENHRMPVIFRVRRQYEALWDEENRLLPVEVTSAVALDPAIAEELGRRIREQTGQNVELTSHVDPNILGGIVLRVGNSILDASIKNRLQQLRKEVAKSA